MKNSKWLNSPLALYYELRKLIGRDCRSDEVTSTILNLGLSSLSFLSPKQRQPLISLVPGKSYFSFSPNGTSLSRPVNKALFCDEDLIKKFLICISSNDFSNISSDEITAACYTLTISFACTVDILNPRDQKTPATYYEYLITHLLTKTIDSKKADQVRVRLSETEEISLTLDLVLDLGVNKPKFHVAIKNSTRERGTEIWAHQRILDEAYLGMYVGLFFALTETKLDHNNQQVVEICVPNQWRVYQQYIGKLDRIYFADPPDAYLRLIDVTPFIVVKPIGDFFFEYKKLINPTVSS